MTWKLFQKTIFVLFFVLLFNREGSAQDIICCNTCDENQVPWNYITYNIILPGMDGMTVQVVCKTRICDGIYELFVENIISINPPATYYSPDEIFTELMKQIILTNPMGFPPDEENPQNIWRFCTYSCWHYLTAENISMGPCGEECCKTEIYVFYEEGCNDKSYELVRQVSNNNIVCPSETIGVLFPCFNVCYPFINPKED